MSLFGDLLSLSYLHLQSNEHASDRVKDIDL